MPAMCCGLPAPAVPCDALSGFALSQAIHSVRLLVGNVFLETISGTPVATSATGVKSLSKS
jgi:hypothetical protein